MAGGKLLHRVTGILLTTSAMVALAPVAQGQTTGNLGTVVLDAGTGYAAGKSRAGTKTETPLEETPASVSVVTQEQIADQSPKSVAQALRYTAGVNAEYRGAM